MRSPLRLVLQLLILGHSLGSLPDHIRVLCSAEHITGNGTTSGVARGERWFLAQPSGPRGQTHTGQQAVCHLHSGPAHSTGLRRDVSGAEPRRHGGEVTPSARLPWPAPSSPPASAGPASHSRPLHSTHTRTRTHTHGRYRSSTMSYPIPPLRPMSKAAPHSLAKGPQALSDAAAKSAGVRPS